MFRMGIIEESLENREILKMFEKYFISQRIEHVPEDEYPTWHTNEYHIPEEEIQELLDTLKEQIKTTWYIHTFNDKTLFVVLQGRWFEIALKKDESWNDMIEYGVKNAKVERRYLENIPIHI